MKYLITGCAGFIGFHLSKKLLQQENKVIGVDNLNDYYDPKLKKVRLNILRRYNNFSFSQVNITDYQKLEKVFREYSPEKVCHLAAQAGVRYSPTHPFVYEETDMLGFLNVLELIRKYKIKDLVFASSFREDMNVHMPISL